MVSVLCHVHPREIASAPTPCHPDAVIAPNPISPQHVCSPLGQRPRRVTHWAGNRDCSSREVWLSLSQCTIFSVCSFQLPSVSLGPCRLALRRASIVGTAGSRETAGYGSISTHRAARLRLRGMTYTCTPRECQCAHCGRQECRRGRGQQGERIRRKLPGREPGKSLQLGD